MAPTLVAGPLRSMSRDGRSMWGPSAIGPVGRCGTAPTAPSPDKPPPAPRRGPCPRPSRRSDRRARRSRRPPTRLPAVRATPGRRPSPSPCPGPPLNALDRVEAAAASGGRDHVQSMVLHPSGHADDGGVVLEHGGHRCAGQDVAVHFLALAVRRDELVALAHDADRDLGSPALGSVGCEGGDRCGVVVVVHEHGSVGARVPGLCRSAVQSGADGSSGFVQDGRDVGREVVVDEPHDAGCRGRRSAVGSRRRRPRRRPRAPPTPMAKPAVSKTGSIVATRSKGGMTGLRTTVRAGMALLTASVVLSTDTSMPLTRFTCPGASPVIRTTRLVAPSASIETSSTSICQCSTWTASALGPYGGRRRAGLLRRSRRCASAGGCRSGRRLGPKESCGRGRFRATPAGTAAIGDDVTSGAEVGVPARNIPIGPPSDHVRGGSERGWPRARPPPQRPRSGYRRRRSPAATTSDRAVGSDRNAFTSAA